jgi:hypothetical protein
LKEHFLSSLTGLDFVLMDDYPAINGWAILKGTHSPVELNKQQSARSIRENSPAIYGWGNRPAKPGKSLQGRKKMLNICPRYARANRLLPLHLSFILYNLSFSPLALKLEFSPSPVLFLPSCDLSPAS